MAEKKSEFVVTDRRRFGTEGEPRPDAQVAEEEKPSAKPAAQATPPAAKTPAPPVPAQPSQSAQTQVQPGSPAAEQEEEMSPPPTAEEEHAQSEAYKASDKKIDDMISAAGKAPQGGPTGRPGRFAIPDHFRKPGFCGGRREMARAFFPASGPARIRRRRPDSLSAPSWRRAPFCACTTVRYQENASDVPSP